jgi:hypothetical protein
MRLVNWAVALLGLLCYLPLRHRAQRPAPGSEPRMAPAVRELEPAA